MENLFEVSKKFLRTWCMG